MKRLKFIGSALVVLISISPFVIAGESSIRKTSGYERSYIALKESIDVCIDGDVDFMGMTLHSQKAYINLRVKKYIGLSKFMEELSKTKGVSEIKLKSYTENFDINFVLIQLSYAP